MDRGAVIAGLPGLSEPSFVPFATVLGALGGSAIARLNRFDRDGVRRWTEDGAFTGAVAGLLLYLIALLLGV